MTEHEPDHDAHGHSPVWHHGSHIEHPEHDHTDEHHHDHDHEEDHRHGHGEHGEHIDRPRSTDLELVGPGDHPMPDPGHGLVDLNGHPVEGLVIDPRSGWISPDPLHDGIVDGATVTAAEHALVHEVLTAADPLVAAGMRQAILDAIFGPT